MPIINYDDTIQIEMGTGDVKVSPGLLQLDYPCGVVAFQEFDEARPIGKWEPNDRKVAAPEETPVRLTFDKVDSIDVVIWALQEAKRMMSEETWQSLLDQPHKCISNNPTMTYEQLNQSHRDWRMLAMNNYSAVVAERDRADQAEAREQKLKEAIETSMELGMLEYATYAYEHFEEALSALYPDTKETSE